MLYSSRINPSLVVPNLGLICRVILCDLVKINNRTYWSIPEHTTTPSQAEHGDNQTASRFHNYLQLYKIINIEIIITVCKISRSVREILLR